MGISNRERFLAGCILPDLSSHEDDSYDLCHYWAVNESQTLKGINWTAFEQNYPKELLQDSVYQGYLCHLIMDSLWFYQIVNPYIRIYPYPERTEYYQKNYHDYIVLNYILSQNYDYIPHIPKVEDCNFPYVKLERWEGFFHAMEVELLHSKIATIEELCLYPYQVIEDYIESASRLCVQELTALRNGTSGINPEDYYVVR